MIKEVETLICDINNIFLEINQSFKKSASYNKINLKKNCVKDIAENNEFLQTIYKYRAFLSKNIKQSEEILNNKNYVNSFEISSRLKTQASIEEKIDRYVEHKEKGKVPIIKCLNDIFGIRIILKTQQIKVIEAENLANREKIKLKYVEKSEGDYKAVHVYFKDVENPNFHFPWELQIWEDKHKKSNMESHKKYKQQYIGYEKLEYSKGKFIEYGQEGSLND